MAFFFYIEQTENQLYMSNSHYKSALVSDICIQANITYEIWLYKLTVDHVGDFKEYINKMSVAFCSQVTE